MKEMLVFLFCLNTMVPAQYVNYKYFSTSLFISNTHLQSVFTAYVVLVIEDTVKKRSG